MVVDMHPFIQTFTNTYLAVFLIWRRYSTAKGAKKNISPNKIRLQYITAAIINDKRPIGHIATLETCPSNKLQRSNSFKSRSF